MEIRQLRYFIAIVEQGSFSRAAAHLHIAQPALSLHVRNMEADMRTRLLHRSPRGVVPTEAGEILLRNARVIVAQLSSVEQEIRGNESEPEGTVSIGLPGTVSEIVSVPLIALARQRYPAIKLRIAEAMSGFVLEWLRVGRVDLAFLYTEVPDHAIKSTRLVEEDLCFISRAIEVDNFELPPLGKPIEFAQATRLPLILPGGGHGLRDLLDQQVASNELSLNAVIDFDSYGGIKELVRNGFGYTILPSHAVLREVHSGDLRRNTIINPTLRRPVFLAHSTDRPVTNATSAISALILEVVRDLVASGRWDGAQLSAELALPPRAASGRRR